MRFAVITVIFISFFSCSTKKDILLMQDSGTSNSYKVEYKDIKIKVDDILRININSKSPELTSLYNSRESLNSNTLMSYQIQGYKVNSDGNVFLPDLGLVYVKNLTVDEIVSKIISLLKTEAILTNPSVDVKLVNAYFSVIGEVNNPGRYNFIKNNINLLQAIAIAGDLTINGKRNDIKIVRKNDDEITVSTVDLTSAKFLISENLQIFPGDIIIVNPNSARVKNAGVVANTGNLLSVLSFILSSLILIINR